MYFRRRVVFFSFANILRNGGIFLFNILHAKTVTNITFYQSLKYILFYITYVTGFQHK